MKTGTLYLVATPIGNYHDITLRAIEILTTADAIICEDPRLASTLLKKLDISPRTYITLDEHNESEVVDQIVLNLVNGQTLALISDCGTPVFSDPGHQLVKAASDFGVPVVSLPGPSSLMTALSLLPFKLEKFIFGGFPDRDKDKRRSELRQLRSSGLPVVLMDTPYRLSRLLDEVCQTFGDGCPATLACDLSLPSETTYRGTLKEIRQAVGMRKAEFILIIHAPARRPRDNNITITRQ